MQNVNALFIFGVLDFNNTCAYEEKCSISYKYKYLCIGKNKSKPRQYRVATPLWGKKFKDFKDIQGDFYQFFKEILPFTGKFWKKFQEFQGDFVSIWVKIFNQAKNWNAIRAYQISVVQLVQSCAYCTLEVKGHDCTSCITSLVFY